MSTPVPTQSRQRVSPITGGGTLAGQGLAGMEGAIRHLATRCPRYAGDVPKPVYIHGALGLRHVVRDARQATSEKFLLCPPQSD